MCGCAQLIMSNLRYDLQSKSRETYVEPQTMLDGVSSMTPWNQHRRVDGVSCTGWTAIHRRLQRMWNEPRAGQAITLGDLIIVYIT